MSKPSLIFTPGSFALPEFYDNIFGPLRATTDVHGLHLPSVGLKTGPRPGVLPSMPDDAAFIASTISSLADQGKDVVLIGHSYGGMPMTQAIKGLSKEERRREGKTGGVVGLGYMTCIVPEVGETAQQFMARDSEGQNSGMTGITVDENGWMAQDPVAAAPWTFSDLPREEGEAWMRRFPTHSSASFGTELTYPGYKDVPVSYLVCTEDLVIREKQQRQGIATIEKASGGRKVNVTEVKSGHCPTVRWEKECLAWFEGVLAKGQEDE